MGWRRGRLIIPFYATIGSIDTEATDTAGGYDQVWRQPRVTYPGGVRTSSRQEILRERLPCQVEVGVTEQQKQSGAGDIPDTRLVLVFHYKDLERLALVDASNNALLRVNDRLITVHDKFGNLSQDYTQRNMYCTESQPREMGLGHRLNLLQMTFEDRPQGRS